MGLEQDSQPFFYDLYTKRTYNIISHQSQYIHKSNISYRNEEIWVTDIFKQILEWYEKEEKTL